MPALLPDLPGIVDDEKFVLDLSTQSPIAPSSALTSPTVKVDLPEDVSIDHLVESSKLPNISDDIVTSDTAVLPPPPPPPPSSSYPKSSELIQQQNSTVVISPQIDTLPLSSPSLPPPPPPPPPPPLAPEPPTTLTIIKKSSTDLTVDAKNNIKIPIAPVDDRTNLMAQIRAAGGIGKAKLKQKPADSTTERWSSASVGGDLMADLHAKLSLRRKGIAGGGSGTSESGMSALERISRLIPPPPKPSEDINSAMSDNDSQVDADEWDD